MLQYLDSVRKAGQNDKGTHFRAACPVHNGKDRNLLVTERHDGSWFCHCFVCNADTKRVKEVLNIPWGEIDPKYVKAKKKGRPYYKGGNEQRIADRMLIQTYKIHGPETYKDKEAYEKASARLRVFNDKMIEWMNDKMGE